MSIPHNLRRIVQIAHDINDPELLNIAGLAVVSYFDTLTLQGEMQIEGLPITGTCDELLDRYAHYIYDPNDLDDYLNNMQNFGFITLL